MSRPSDQAEKTYLAALDLEAEGRTKEALAAYQTIIDQHDALLWSDAASQAMDRIAAGVPLSSRLSQARKPFCKRFTRPLSLPHALITILILVVQSIVAGPLIAGSWLVLVAMDLAPLMFIYLVGGIPAAISGFLFSAWILHYCHGKGFMPERTTLAGMIFGVVAVLLFSWGLVPLYASDFPPSGVVMFMVIHGLVGGAFTGWLGGKLVWYRMDRNAPPYPVETLDGAHESR